MEVSTRKSRQAKKKQGLPAQEVLKQLRASPEQEGFWLPASSLQQLFSSLPASPQYINREMSPDTSSSDSMPDSELIARRGRARGCTTNSLPPIGVFWDIENCQVPREVSALAVVQMVREKFFTGYREAEFVVVCDVTKENQQVVQELNVAQIDLVHVSSICKNAADEKLRQSLRRFAERHGSPSTVILISGDINFAADLSDLRHRKKINVILLHQNNTSEALILCSDQNYDYSELTKNLPQRSMGKGMITNPQPMDLLVTNLPDSGASKIKNRLRLLSANCGGRVISMCNSEAVMRFSNADAAYRARLRMEGEDVFGCKIHVGAPQPARSSSEQQNTSGLISPQSVGGRPVMAAPWPGRAPTFSSTATSQFQQYQQQLTNFRTIRGRHSQSPRDEQFFETSLSSVSAMFHPSALPPPNTLPMHMPSPAERKQNSPSPHYFNSSPFPVRADADGSEGFQPIQPTLEPNAMSSPVDLQVSNLDHSLDLKEVRRLLLAAFKEHVMVLHIQVFNQSDGQMSARVRVGSRQDAQVAVAAMHRQLIGNRRIRISVLNQINRSQSPCTQLVRAQVAALLKEVPNQRLPLFQLCELFEKRFLSSVSLSELNRMRDLVNISEELGGGGRVVSLLPESRRSVTPSFADMAIAAFQEGQMPELPYCPIHALQDNAGAGWAEKTLQPLPNVNIQLPAFSKAIFAVLSSHQGALPLYSLPLCFEAEMRHPLIPDDTGVPLEHLVTWVKGITLKCSPNGGCAKMLTWGTGPQVYSSDESNGSDLERSTSPAQLAAQVALFGREVVELLRASPRCQLPFVKFIPAYHHHFGRQCRVANYGFTRLIDLLDALPNVVQVIGEGDARAVVLAQPAQIRRFTSDLLRVLKAQPNKQATLSELAELFTKGLGRNFDPVEYGLCDVADLVSRVPQNTVVLTPPIQEGGVLHKSTVLALPKRDQTPEEVERTRHFAREVVSLLRDAPQCSILFNKFIPAYHHHFGHQCRLADYGMTKLAELLAAVSDVAQVEEVAGGERRIVLALPERQRVLGEQVKALLAASANGSLLLSQLSSTYQRQYGIALDPAMYAATTTFELVHSLANWVQVVPSDRGPLLQPIKYTQNLGPKVLQLVFDAPEYRTSMAELSHQFETKYHHSVHPSDLKILERSVYVSNGEVGLTSLYVAAAQIRTVLQEQGGSCLLSSLFSLYVVQWGRPLNPAEFGHTSLPALLNELSDIFTISGRGKKRTVHLRDTIRDTDAATKGHAETAVPVSSADSQDMGYMMWGSLLPLPANSKPPATATVTTSVWDKNTNTTPWIGQPLGLHANRENNVWSVSTPVKLWSPPKTMKTVIAPDPSELPMPSLLEQWTKEAPTQENNGSNTNTTPPTDTHNLSDSGIGHTSPTSPAPPTTRRRHRLAAHFSSPIELL